MLPTDLDKTQSYKYDGRDIGKFINTTTNTASNHCYETGRTRSITSNIYLFEKLTIYGDSQLVQVVSSKVK
jgi:hypothetical protein